MHVDDIPEIAEMTVAEKIVFLENLWRSIAEHDHDVLVPESHIHELDRRLEQYRADPSQQPFVQDHGRC